MYLTAVLIVLLVMVYSFGIFRTEAASKDVEYIRLIYNLVQNEEFHTAKVRENMLELRDASGILIAESANVNMEGIKTLKRLDGSAFYFASY